MLYLVLSLIALGAFAALIHLLFSKKGKEEKVKMPTSSSCATCNGLDPKCEQECMMEASTREIEYYEDEELDAFKGKASNDYTEKEVSQFSEVLYTMRPDEVKGWSRSLTLRGINLPDQLKDEVFMMIEER
jgi:hypothetical protein